MKDVSKDNSHSPELTKGVLSIFKDSMGLVAHFIELIAIETRLAGTSLVLIFTVAIGIVMLLVATWLLLMAALAFAMVGAGYGWGAALVALAMLNLLALIPLAYVVVRLSRNLWFRFTLQQAKDLIATGEDSHAAA